MTYSTMIDDNIVHRMIVLRWMCVVLKASECVVLWRTHNTYVSHVQKDCIAVGFGRNFEDALYLIMKSRIADPRAIRAFRQLNYPISRDIPSSKAD